MSNVWWWWWCLTVQAAAFQHGGLWTFASIVGKCVPWRCDAKWPLHLRVSNGSFWRADRIGAWVLDDFHRARCSCHKMDICKNAMLCPYEFLITHWTTEKAGKQCSTKQKHDNKGNKRMRRNVREELVSLWFQASRVRMCRDSEGD